MQEDKIFIAGHKGMVGSALFRKLKKLNVSLITATRDELNLLNYTDVNKFLSKQKPDLIFIAAAKVGGIYANDNFPAEFIHQNLQIQLNLIHSAFENNIKRILFLGSSCIYPKFAEQPINENQLLSGQLESTNEPYAIAKIAGIKLCESYNRQYGLSHQIDYRAVMPCNLYGIGDNYHPINSHVLPALINKFHNAKTNNLDNVTIWGSGKPRREFLNVDDLADACIQVISIEKNKYYSLLDGNSCHINIGSGEDFEIIQIANMVAKIIGFKGEISLDLSKPDGTPRKLLDISNIRKLGWSPKISLEDGIRLAYKDYLENHYE